MLILKRLPAIHGRPMISNCDKLTEKAYEFVDFLLKAVMQDGLSYIKNSRDFINKIENLKKILSNSI